MKKVLLREYHALCEGGICQDFLTEAEKRMVNEHGAVFMTGVIQQANVPNGNNRIYSRAILEREITTYQKMIESNRALGELDHPEDSVVNLRNVSHIVRGAWWDGDNVMGKIQCLDTPAGNILKNLAEGGVQLGISSRGMGSVHESNGKTIVEDDYQLICWDCVSDPSVADATLQLTESQQRELRNNIWTKADRINRALYDALK